MPYKDPEKARENARKYYREHREEIIKKRKKIRKQNREEYLRKRREWYRLNRESYLKRQREWAKKNYSKNREKILTYYKEWKKKHPYNYEKYRKQTNELDRKKRIKIITRLGGKCVHCGIDEIKVLQLHHIDGREKDEGKKFWGVSNLDFSKFKLLCANCHTLEHWRLKYG